IFTASLGDVRSFASILRGIMLSNRVTMTISEAGLALTVQEMRTSLAKAYILRGLFDEYKYNHLADETEGIDVPSSTFEIGLDTLLECLNIFGSGGGSAFLAHSEKGGKRGWHNKSDDNEDNEDRPNRTGALKPSWNKGVEKVTMMKMTYQDTGYPLVLILAEDSSGPTTTVEITTLESAENLDLPFEDNDAVMRIIMKVRTSFWLRDALTEVDSTCDKLTFICTPLSEQRQSRHGRKRMVLENALLVSDARPAFRIQCTGSYGTTYMDYPSDSDVLETFDCEQAIQFSYSFKPLSRVVRSLSTSIKSSLRIDSTGLLSIQFQLPEVKGKNAYIDFLVSGSPVRPPGKPHSMSITNSPFCRRVYPEVMI
ncbi:hypothetical protein BS47DRAFT_1306090, partial [Hydnum rufescens UP504]